MIVILCHPDDHAALWLYEALRALGLDGLEIVSVEQFVYSRKIVHRLDDSCDTGEIHIADGRILRADQIRGLINRMRYLPTEHFAAADPADRTYATEELGAFMLAWLDGVGGRVINPARPAMPDGGSFPAATLAHLATMAGLPTEPWRAGTFEASDDALPRSRPTHTPIVFDGRVFGPVLPRGLQDGCRRLAVLLGAPLLEVAFQLSHDCGWQFLGASGAANFPAGGKALAAAIHRVLSSQAAG